MKQRLITGTCYVAALVAFFLLKIYLPYPWNFLSFDLLLWFFSVVGTFEMLRALGGRMTAAERVVALLFSLLYIPAYDVSVYAVGYDKLSVMGVSFFLVCLVFLALFVVQYEKTSLESVGCSLLACVYPTLLIGTMVLCNHLERYSDLALLFVFVISPCADSLAYLFGISLGKKFPCKISPHISPKKTVVGCVGGIVGGVLGALILFFLYHLAAGQGIPYDTLWIYLLIGAGASVFTEFGDLVESAIKRKEGIKDMGNILPGHGGILDRIDGTMYAAVLVYAVFYILIGINVL